MTPITVSRPTTVAARVLIKKADGEEEPFDPAKLEKSLELAGASSTARARIAARIMREIENAVIGGVERTKRKSDVFGFSSRGAGNLAPEEAKFTTEEIYRRAFDILRKEEAPPVAARYSVKRAVFELGPSGFPFEQFLAEVLRAHGWKTRTGVALTGRCAPHEVDVVAEKGGKRVGIEAKFHNDAGGKTDIKDALYVHARYEDLKNTPEASSRVDEGWLITNTRFTRNAIRYAQCSNLTLIGWDYPHGRNLYSLIEEARVHPLTCLTTLSGSEKNRFLDKRIVLCKSISTRHILEEYGVKPARIPQVLDEAKQLCGI